MFKNLNGKRQYTSTEKSDNRQSDDYSDTKCSNRDTLSFDIYLSDEIR